MDAFTHRVELEESDELGELASPVQPSSSAATDDNSSESTLSDDQVVPGQEHHFVTLSARRRPFYEAPEFVQRLNVFEELEQGAGLTFECQIRAFPRPIVKWFKDDVEISSSEDGRVTADEWPVDTGSSSISSFLRLSIRDARKDDEGAYRCKAENEEGVAATTGYLSVTGSSSSPRINAVSTPPLLRAITEQQSMEEREAASYQLQAAISGFSEEDYDYERLPDQTPDDDNINSQLGWTYADYMKAAGLDPGDTPQDVDSGSNTSVEADVEDDRIIVEKRTSSSLAGLSTSSDLRSVERCIDPTSTDMSPERSGRHSATDQPEVGSVNVFVVDSKQSEASRDDATSNIDMKPLLIQSVGFQPTVLQSNHDTVLEHTTQQQIPGPTTVSDVLPFHTDALYTSPNVGQTHSDDVFRVLEAGGEWLKESGITRDKDMIEPPKPQTDELFQAAEPSTKVEVAGGVRHPSGVEAQPLRVEKPAVVEGPRRVVELNYSNVMEFCCGWFDSPWIVYVLVVLGVTVMACVTDADPAAVIVTVLVATLLCLCVCPPPSHGVDDATSVTSSE